MVTFLNIEWEMGFFLTYWFEVLLTEVFLSEVIIIKTGKTLNIFLIQDQLMSFGSQKSLNSGGEGRERK